MSSPPIGIEDVDPERLDDAERVCREVERPVSRRLAREVARAPRRRGRGSGSCARCGGTSRPCGRSCERSRPSAAGTTRLRSPGSSRSCCRRAAQPRLSPTTSWPSWTTRFTTALMHGLSPGTSPPPVRIPILIARVISRPRAGNHMVLRGPLLLVCAWVTLGRSPGRQSRPPAALSGAPACRGMPKVGLEPTRPCGHRILSPARLPVPPLRPAGMVRRGTVSGVCGRRPALPAGRPRAAPPCAAQKEGARGGTMWSPICLDSPPS